MHKFLWKKCKECHPDVGFHDRGNSCLANLLQGTVSKQLLPRKVKELSEHDITFGLGVTKLLTQLYSTG